MAGKSGRVPVVVYLTVRYLIASNFPQSKLRKGAAYVCMHCYHFEIVLVLPQYDKDGYDCHGSTRKNTEE